MEEHRHLNVAHWKGSVCGGGGEGGAEDVQKTDDKPRVGGSEICLEFSGVRNIFVRFTCVFLHLVFPGTLGWGIEVGKKLYFHAPIRFGVVTWLSLANEMWVEVPCDALVKVLNSYMKRPCELLLGFVITGALSVALQTDTCRWGEPRERRRTLRLGRWEFNKPGNLPTGLCWTVVRRVDLSTSGRIWSFYSFVAVVGHVYHPDGANCTLLSSGCVLSSHYGNGGQNLPSQSRGGVRSLWLLGPSSQVKGQWYRHGNFLHNRIKPRPYLQDR